MLEEHAQIITDNFELCPESPIGFCWRKDLVKLNGEPSDKAGKYINTKGFKFTFKGVKYNREGIIRFLTTGNAESLLLTPLPIRRHKLVYGVGINNANYCVTKTDKTTGEVWQCPYHRRWSGMLARCYSDRVKKISPTYSGVTVCEQWHTFLTFKSWVIEQENLYNFSITDESWELDKDILVLGNKIYSPSACVFVKSNVNSLLLVRQEGRGEYPLGVCKIKDGRFVAQGNEQGKSRVNLGLYSTPEEAHRAWQKHKSEVIRKVALEQNNPTVTEALLMRSYRLNEDIRMGRETKSL